MTGRQIDCHDFASDLQLMFSGRSGFEQIRHCVPPASATLLEHQGRNEEYTADFMPAENREGKLVVIYGAVIECDKSGIIRQARFTPKRAEYLIQADNAAPLRELADLHVELRGRAGKGFVIEHE